MEATTSEQTEPAITPPMDYTKERLEEIWQAWSTYGEQLWDEYKGKLPEGIRKMITPSPPPAPEGPPEGSA